MSTENSNYRVYCDKRNLHLLQNILMVYVVKYRSFPSTIQKLFVLYIIGFSLGTITHIMALVEYGVILSPEAPLWKNFYWTSLTLFDFIAVVLLLRSVVPALITSNAIIISDVMINIDGFDFSTFQLSVDYRLVFQIMFCAYILITTPVIFFTYRRSKTPAASVTSVNLD